MYFVSRFSGPVRVFPFFLLQRKNTSATSATRTATPLSVPPTMAPVWLTPPSVSGASAAAVAVAVSDTSSVLDPVSELVEELLVDDVREELFPVIPRLTVSYLTADLPSAAVATLPDRPVPVPHPTCVKPPSNTFS